jgi:hypothetical protein
MLEAIGLTKCYVTAGERLANLINNELKLGWFSSRSCAACRACGGLCEHIQ